MPGYVHTETRKDGNTTTFINQYREVVVPTPPGKKKRSGGGLTYLDDYETPLGVQVIINHVGDCYE